jgi:hypothetical protein
VLDDVSYDDGESPAIGIAPPGTTRQQAADHIKIAHSPLLIAGPDGEYTGVYWTGTRMVLIEGLGSDQDEALADFRASLRELGEA